MASIGMDQGGLPGGKGLGAIRQTSLADKATD